MNLASLLMDHPFADGDGLLHTFDRTVSAGEARARAIEVAAGLGALDGRAVAVQLPNGPEVVWTMVGVWLAGGVYGPLNPRDPDLTATLEATKPAAVIRSTIYRLDDAEPYADDVAFVMWTSGTTGKPNPIHHTHT